MAGVQIDLEGRCQTESLSSVNEESRKEINGLIDGVDPCDGHKAKREGSKRGLNQLLILAESAEQMETPKIPQNTSANCQRHEDEQCKEDKAQTSSQTHVLSEDLHGRTRISKVRRLARKKDVSSTIKIDQNHEVKGKNNVEGHNLQKPGELQTEQNPFVYLVNGGHNDWRHGVHNPFYYPVNVVAVPPQQLRGQGCIARPPWQDPNYWDSTRVIARQRRLLRSLERKKQAQKRFSISVNNKQILQPQPQLMFIPPYGQPPPLPYAFPVSVGVEQSQTASKQADIPMLPNHPSAESKENHKLSANADDVPRKRRPDSKKDRLTNVKCEARLKLMQD